MKLSSSCLWGCGLLWCLLVLAVAGCSGGGYPISMEVTVPLGEDFSVTDFGAANPGDILTPDTDIPAVPYCTFPDRDTVDELVREAVGGLVGGMLEVERLELVDITIEAVENDFDSFTGLSMSYEPKPILGMDQPAVELGATSSDDGLGTVIRLEPPEPVDFLELIEENEDNPTLDCPMFDVEMSGTVPAEMPRWNVTLNLRVVGEVGL